LPTKWLTDMYCMRSLTDRESFSGLLPDLSGELGEWDEISGVQRKQSSSMTSCADEEFRLATWLAMRTRLIMMTVSPALVMSIIPSSWRVAAMSWGHMPVLEEIPATDTKIPLELFCDTSRESIKRRNRETHRESHDSLVE